jgi:D-alanine-D-alanine ligase
MANSDAGVLVLYNVPLCADELGGAACAESDAGVLGEVEAVAGALAALGIPYRPVGIRRLSDLPVELAIAPEATVFNLVESLRGDPHDFNLVPAVCRAFGKGCTGSDTPCLLQSLDKWQAKAVLRAAGLPTPEAVVLTETACRLPELPAGPLIVKPLLTDASEGIDADCVFESAGPPVWDAARRVHRQFGCPALVERFIEGREINVSLLQQESDTTVLPLAEIEFVDFGQGRPRIVGYRAKWLADTFEFRNTVRRVPAELPDPVAEDLRSCARQAWQAFACRDYARVDFRLDGDLRPYVLEVNTNPDVSPDGGFAAALAAAGILYEQFVQAVVQNALRRLRQGGPVVAAVPGEAPPKAVPSIRRSLPEDRDAILTMAVRTQAFRPDEIAVAREVLDAALLEGPAGHYQSYTAVVDGEPVGWVCFGPIACTLGTFDLYWIVVAPQVQGKGIGRALLAHAEELIARAGGRVVVIETSGRPSNHSTRQFYLKAGYEEEARLADFYAPGDDKVVYVKRLPTPH